MSRVLINNSWRQWKVETDNKRFCNKKKKLHVCCCFFFHFLPWDKKQQKNYCETRWIESRENSVNSQLEVMLVIFFHLWKTLQSTWLYIHIFFCWSFLLRGEKMQFTFFLSEIYIFIYDFVRNISVFLSTDNEKVS